MSLVKSKNTSKNKSSLLKLVDPRYHSKIKGNWKGTGIKNSVSNTYIIISLEINEIIISILKNIKTKKI
jgi:hypothetical protein